MARLTDRLRGAMLSPFEGKVAPRQNGAHEVKHTGVSFVGSPDWSQIIHLGTGTDPDAEALSRQIAFATSAYAYTAIMYRATRVAEPALRVVQETDDGDEEVDGHELSMMLQEPSLDYDMGELQQLTEIYRCITGAALWVKELDVATRPARWVPFSGDEFTSHSADGRIYGRFRVETATGPRVYSAEEVVHFREVNPNSWRHPMAKLDVALSMLDLGHQTTRTVRNYMRKAMFPGGVVSPDPQWNPSPDEWAQWKSEIMAWHQGPANAGDPLVVQGGTQFSKAALGLKDLLPDEMLDRIEAVVGSVFAIPPVVLGWLVGLKNSPWSQMSEARQMTYEDTIEPRWRDVERKMTRQILEEREREAGRRIAFDTSKVRAFQSDDKTRAEVAATMRNEWTVNERRVYTGQDPFPEEDERGDEIGSSGPALFGAMTEALGMDRKALRPGNEPGELSTKEFYYTLFDLSTKAAERTWDRQITKGLKEAKADALSIFDRTVREAKQEAPDRDSMVEFVAVYGDYIREKAEPFFVQLTLPLVMSTGGVAIKTAAAQTGVSFTVLQPYLASYALEEAEFLASAMGETTGKAIADLVQRELNSGTTIRQMRKAIEEATTFNRKRSERIARTETTRAWNGAQRRSLSDWEKEQSEEVRVLKEWVDSGDDRVRPDHALLGEGEPVPIDEQFANGLQGPGEPNCRCTMVYSIAEAETDG